MKVVVVGQRNVGKTQLTAQLSNPNPKAAQKSSDKPTTITTTTTTTPADDIDITKWEFVKELQDNTPKDKPGRVCCSFIQFLTPGLEAI